MKKKPNPDSSKHKIKKWQKVLLIATSILVVCILTMAILINMELNKVKKHVPKPTVVPQNETFETDDQPPVSDAPIVSPDEVIWPKEIQPISEHGVLNILLIGQDRYPGQTTRQRSDSMIILSYNSKNKTVTLISLMRDMYIQIPGYSDNRINAAYQFGDIELPGQHDFQKFRRTN